MFLLALFLVFQIGISSYEVDSGVHLSQIGSLTFGNQYTKGKRSEPIPQLNCIGDCNHQPSEIFCRNLGFDHQTNEYKWNCEADLPDHIDLEDVRVSCEGYSGPGDQTVVRGSCGLFYTLSDQSLRPQREHTTTTTRYEEEIYEEQDNRRSQPQRVYSRQNESDGSLGFFALSPTMILIVFIVIIFLLCFCCTGSGNRNQRSYPPHHSPRVVDRSFASAPPPPVNPHYGGGGSGSSHVHHHHHGTTHHSSRGSGFANGLMTGVHLGSAASSGFGRRRYPVNNHYHQAPQRSTNISSQPRVIRRTTTTTTSSPSSSSSSTTRKSATGGSTSSRSHTRRSRPSSSSTTRKSKTGGTHSR